MIRNISVIGIGKLGASMMAGFAEVGFNTIGYDIDANKISLINQGKAPVEETDLDFFINKNKKKIKATDDIQFAIDHSEISFIVVPTPSNNDGAFTSKPALDVFEKIGLALKNKSSYHVVVLTSTVLPGITRSLLIPALEKSSGKQCGLDFGICYNPEFIALGSVINDFLNPDFYLLGEFDKKSGNLLEQVHNKVSRNSAPVKRMTIENAELAKIALNSFVTMKISFANILADLCMKIPSGDVDKVSSALGLDSRIGRKYLTGGMGFAGPCFPRDNVALNYFGKKVGADTELLKENHEYNERLNSKIFENLLTLIIDCKKIAVLGLSYKPNSFLVEKSPGVDLSNLLFSKGFDVKCFDPMAYEEAKNKLTKGIHLCESVEEAIKNSEAIFIATPDAKFINAIQNASKNLILIDLWRFLDKKLSSKFENYIGYGVCLDDENSKKNLQNLWSDYE